MKSDKILLNHILDCIVKIQNYTDSGRTNFLQDEKSQDATIRNLEIIGEAVKSLSPSLKEKNIQIPWKNISGLRDVLIHNYFGVDLNLVWNVVEKDLAELKLKILDIYRTQKIS